MTQTIKLFTTIVTLLAIAATTACQTTKLDPKNPKGNLIISMERTPCYGRCPIYEIKIYDDGLLLYSGKKFVEKEGSAYRKLSTQDIENLKTAFTTADFFNLSKSYPDSGRVPSDLPSIIISYKQNILEKTVTDHRFHTPESLTAIEKRIDSAATLQFLQFYDN